MKHGEEGGERKQNQENCKERVSQVLLYIPIFIGEKDAKDTLFSSGLNGWYIRKALSKNFLCLLNTDVQPSYKVLLFQKIENSEGKHICVLKTQHEITVE